MDSEKTPAGARKTRRILTHYYVSVYSNHSIGDMLLCRFVSVAFIIQLQFIVTQTMLQPYPNHFTPKYPRNKKRRKKIRREINIAIYGKGQQRHARGNPHTVCGGGGMCGYRCCCTNTYPNNRVHHQNKPAKKIFCYIKRGNKVLCKLLSTIGFIAIFRAKRHKKYRDKT